MRIIYRQWHFSYVDRMPNLHNLFQAYNSFCLRSWMSFFAITAPASDLTMQEMPLRQTLIITVVRFCSLAVWLMVFVFQWRVSGETGSGECMQCNINNGLTQAAYGKHMECRRDWFIFASCSSLLRRSSANTNSCTAMHVRHSAFSLALQRWKAIKV